MSFQNSNFDASRRGRISYRHRCNTEEQTKCHIVRCAWLCRNSARCEPQLNGDHCCCTLYTNWTTSTAVVVPRLYLVPNTSIFYCCRSPYIARYSVILYPNQVNLLVLCCSYSSGGGKKSVEEQYLYQLRTHYEFVYEYTSRLFLHCHGNNTYAYCCGSYDIPAR